MPFTILTNKSQKMIGLFITSAAVLACMAASVIFGVMDTDWRTVVAAYQHFNGTNEHIIIRDVRVPRAFIAAAVGASLGISGVLLQALTRNPLADAGIFGLNHGAGMFIVLAVSLFSISSISSFTWIAFLGTAVSGMFIYFLGSSGRSGMTPVKITLAGAAVTALAQSVIQAVLVINRQTTEEVLFWLAGSVEGRKLEVLFSVLPFMIFAWIGSLLISGAINTLMLGEDVAKGLGQKTVLLKAAMAAFIVILVGSSVAVAGPIAFIGLIIPHLSRAVAGGDLRWMILYSGLLGAVLVLLSDIAARFVAMPKETPIGVVTALIGTPFFIYAARKGISK